MKGGVQLVLIDSFKSAGGKDLIIDFIDSLDKFEKAEGYLLLEHLEEIESIDACIFYTKKIQEKVWEFKFKNHIRIFYVLCSKIYIYLLHVCKKQKNKTERHDKELALKRAKEIMK